jgi:hypothetical protein
LESGKFCTSATDPDGHKVKYRFDWGDGTTSGWTSFVPSGTEACINHAWSNPGTYIVKAQARDQYEDTSSWSYGLTVVVSGIHNLPGWAESLLQLTDYWDIIDDYWQWNQDHLLINVPIKSEGFGGLLPSTDGSVPGGIPEGTTEDDNGNSFDGDYNFDIEFDATLAIKWYPDDLQKSSITLEEASGGCDLDMEMAGETPYGDLGFSLGIHGDFKYEDDFEWNANIALGGNIEFFPLIFFTVIPPGIPIYVSISFNVHTGVTFYFGSPDEWKDSEDIFSNVYKKTTGDIGLGARFKEAVGIPLIIGAGVYQDVDGTWYFKDVPGDDDELFDYFQLIFAVGLFVEILGFEVWDWEFYNTSWNSNERTIDNNRSNPPKWKFMSRDYNNPKHVFSDDGEILIEEAFPASHPTLLRVNDNKLLIWTEDDKNINPGDDNRGDGLELWIAERSVNGYWFQPKRITNDYRGQSNPSAAYDFDNSNENNLYCVFEYLPESNDKTPEEMMSGSEIGFLARDSWNYWSDNPSLIVDGGTPEAMDSFPVIKSYPNFPDPTKETQVVVVWMCDKDANIFTVDDRILYSSFYDTDENKWFNTRIISDKNIISAPVSLAFKDEKAVCAYAVDEDGNLATKGDQHIYLTEFTANSDPVTTRITTIGGNLNPSISFIGEDISIVWIRDEDTDNGFSRKILYRQTPTGQTEIVESGVNRANSIPLFYEESSIDGGSDSYIPLVAWSNCNELCFKRRLNGIWNEDPIVLHTSEKEITQLCWEYEGEGEELIALFVEKNKFNSLKDCQMVYLNPSNMFFPETPTLKGPTKVNEGQTCTYTAVTTDLDDDIAYHFEWIVLHKSPQRYTSRHPETGYLPSGTEVKQEITWGESHTTYVRVKAVDEAGHESDWAQLDVRVPRNRHSSDSLYFRLIMRLVERFPFLARLLQLLPTIK